MHMGRTHTRTQWPRGIVSTWHLELLQSSSQRTLKERNKPALPACSSCICTVGTEEGDRSKFQASLVTWKDLAQSGLRGKTLSQKEK